MKYNFVAIEGNIGAGKTTLAQKLAKERQASLILEEFDQNTFLEKFYINPEQYAFPLEVSFLVKRFNQLEQRLSKSDLFSAGSFISDYFFDKSLIFAQNTLKEDQYRIFYQLYQVFIKQIPRPELLIFLYNTVENLQKNIRNRGRLFEKNIERTYLDDIQQAYFSYLKNLKGISVIFLNVTDADFVNDVSKYQKINAMLDKSWPEGISVMKL